MKSFATFLILAMVMISVGSMYIYASQPKVVIEIVDEDGVPQKVFGKLSLSLASKTGGYVLRGLKLVNASKVYVDVPPWTDLQKSLTKDWLLKHSLLLLAFVPRKGLDYINLVLKPVNVEIDRQHLAVKLVFPRIWITKICVYTEDGKPIAKAWAEPLTEVRTGTWTYQSWIYTGRNGCTPPIQVFRGLRMKVGHILAKIVTLNVTESMIRVEMPYPSVVELKILDRRGEPLSLVWIGKYEYAEYCRYRYPVVNGSVKLPIEFLASNSKLCIGVELKSDIYTVRTIYAKLSNKDIVTKRRVVLNVSGIHVRIPIVFDNGTPIRGKVRIRLEAIVRMGAFKEEVVSPGIEVGIDGVLDIVIPSKAGKLSLNLAIEYANRSILVNTTKLPRFVSIDLTPPTILSISYRIEWTTVWGTKCVGLWITVKAVDPNKYASGVAKVYIANRNVLEISRTGIDTWTIFADCALTPGKIFRGTIVAEDAQGNRAVKSIEVIMKPGTSKTLTYTPTTTSRTPTQRVPMASNAWLYLLAAIILIIIVIAALLYVRRRSRKEIERTEGRTT